MRFGELFTGPNIVGMRSDVLTVSCPEQKSDDVNIVVSHIARAYDIGKAHGRQHNPAGDNR